MNTSEIRPRMNINPIGERKDWRVTDPRDYPYDPCFAGVLEGNIDDLVNEIKIRKNKPLVLDFMGYGQILRSLNPHAGLAVALSDIRNKIGVWSDKRKNISVIDGNVLHRKTWRRMENWLDYQDTTDKKFSLIIARPVGGLEYLSKRPEIHGLLLQRAWKLLSSDGGVLLTQFDPRITICSDIEKLVNKLNQTEGILAEYSKERSLCCDAMSFKPVLKIIKNQNAPESLPIFNSEI